jgi:hypothetical protein
LSQTLMFNRLILQISSLARNGVPEYYLLLAARKVVHRGCRLG